MRLRHVLQNNYEAKQFYFYPRENVGDSLKKKRGISSRITLVHYNNQYEVTHSADLHTDVWSQLKVKRSIVNRQLCL